MSQMNQDKLHPIQETLHACKDYFITIPTPETEALLSQIENALIETHKLLAGVEYVNELVTSLLTEIKACKNLV
jgi:hypothetical protein